MVVVLGSCCNAHTRGVFAPAADFFFLLPVQLQTRANNGVVWHLSRSNSFTV